MRLGDPLARGLLPARSHWRFCAMGKAVCRGAPSVVVLCEPPRTAYGFNPGMLSDRPRGPDLAPQRGNAHQDGGAFCWIKWSYVEPQRKVAELERSRERLASNTSPLVGFEQFARFRQRRLELREQARFAGARPRHHGKRSDRVRPSRVRARAASRRVRAHVRQIFVKPRRAESWKWVRSGPRPVTS